MHVCMCVCVCVEPAKINLNIPICTLFGRNEQFQEELWKRSFEFLKDHLSPESVEKYSLPPSLALPHDDTPTAAAMEESSTQVQGEPHAATATGGGLNKEGGAAALEQQLLQD